MGSIRLFYVPWFALELAGFRQPAVQIRGLEGDELVPLWWLVVGMGAQWVQGLPRKVDVRLPGKGNSNSHGARPVRLIITMIKWVRTGRLSIKNSLCAGRACLLRAGGREPAGPYSRTVPRTLWQS